MGLNSNCLTFPSVRPPWRRTAVTNTATGSSLTSIFQGVRSTFLQPSTCALGNAYLCRISRSLSDNKVDRNFGAQVPLLLIPLIQLFVHAKAGRRGEQGQSINLVSIICCCLIKHVGGGTKIPTFPDLFLESLGRFGQTCPKNMSKSSSLLVFLISPWQTHKASPPSKRLLHCLAKAPSRQHWLDPG